MLRTILISAALVLTGASAHAQEMSEVETVARAYMDAYSELDWPAMERFLAEDVIFADETSTDPEHPGGIDLVGRDALRQTLDDFIAQYNPITLGFEWDTVFESNSRVVFIGHVNALYPTLDPAQRFRWRSQQVTVVTVEGGRVVEHRDYANYPGAEQGLIPAE